MEFEIGISLEAKKDSQQRKDHFGPHRWVCVEVVLVPHRVTGPVPRPELARVVVGAGTKDVADRVPGQRPNDRLVRLFLRKENVLKLIRQAWNKLKG